MLLIQRAHAGRRLESGAWSSTSVRRLEDPGPADRSQARFIADLTARLRGGRIRPSSGGGGSNRRVGTSRRCLVFTATDLTGVGSIEPILHRPDYFRARQPLLATDRVNYLGEPIAAVVAATRREAEDGVDAVFVDLELQEPVVHSTGALSDSSRIVHPGAESNVVVSGTIDTGNVDVLSASAVERVELDLTCHRQSASPIETRGAVARYDLETEKVTLYASTQMPHVLRTAICDLLTMPEADLRVVAPAVGGAFGQKMCLPAEYAVIVWLSRHLRRSLAWIEDRRENFTSSFHSRDHRYWIQGSFDGDGRLVALEGDLVANVGAYSCYPVTWGVEPLMAMAELPAHTTSSHPGCAPGGFPPTPVQCRPTAESHGPYHDPGDGADDGHGCTSALDWTLLRSDAET